MKINANFDEPVALHTGAMEWTPSPMAGVDRLMLDRIGGEVARATSIVRYAPGSHFSEHTHSGGEEFIVLEGTFQDEHGDYPAGSYVRNPIGTHHVPRADEGCTIFVKLWQFAQDDQKQFALDLNSLRPEPLSRLPGVARAELHQTASESVSLEHWQPGAARGFSDESGTEILILDGSVIFGSESFARHDWLRLPPGWADTIVAGPSGARVWLKTGHLQEICENGWQSPQA